MKDAQPKYDWYMFLVLILIETLEDRRVYTNLFYQSKESQWTDFNKVIEYARTYCDNSILGPLIVALLNKLEVVG